MSGNDTLIASVSRPASGTSRRIASSSRRSTSELDMPDEVGLSVRRPLLATLAWAGLRVGEACALRWRDVHLAKGVTNVVESKTEAGIREADVQPELHEELTTWRARTPFSGRDDLVFA